MNGLKVVRVLLENGARPSLLNDRFQRAIDVAANGFQGVCTGEKIQQFNQHFNNDSVTKSEQLVEAKRQSRMNLLCFSPQSRTLVLHHPECLEHIPKSKSDWEAPARVSSIISSMSSKVKEYEVHVSTDFDKASLELLSRVHSAEYLTFVNDLSKELEKRSEQLELVCDNAGQTKTKKEATVVPFTPMVCIDIILCRLIDTTSLHVSDFFYSLFILGSTNYA
jgi:hypothetical protein